MKLDRKKERTRILNRILLLKALHHVDEQGNVILNKRYMFPKWIDCQSCKFCVGAINAWPISCPRRTRNRVIDVMWKDSVLLGWICLSHEFKEKQPK